MIVKILMIVITLLSQVFHSFGYPQYNSDFPNGNIVPPSAIELGHPGGNKRSYTPLAKFYVNQGYRWTTSLCQTDSDQDGQSNGLEMGDPCCIWTVGAAPTFTIGLSDPNNPSSKTQNIMPTCL
jgi:hypothetical protein